MDPAGQTLKWVIRPHHQLAADALRFEFQPVGRVEVNSLAGGVFRR